MWVGDCWRSMARSTHIKVRTLQATVTFPTLELCLANIAGNRERWLRGIVQVIEDHHGGMFRAPGCVKLIVIALAQREELIPRIKELIVNLRNVIARWR